jgi:hypothetical protein
VPRTSVVRVEGINRLLRAFNKFGKEANQELKAEAQQVADRIMVPAYKSRARAVPTWGDFLSQDIRSKKDRLPAVNIGYRTPRLRGGANPLMLRYPTYSGQQRASTAPFQQTMWIKKAGRDYKPQAMEAYADAVERVVRKWNRGP